MERSLKKEEIVREHLTYELSMFYNCYSLLQRGVTDQFIANLLIESFGIHARNIIDFFYDTPAEKSQDAAARHFTNKGYIPFAGKKVKQMREYKKINEQVAHISYQRTEDLKDKMGVEDRDVLKELIEKEMENFCDHLKEPYRELFLMALLPA